MQTVHISYLAAHRNDMWPKYDRYERTKKSSIGFQGHFVLFHDDDIVTFCFRRDNENNEN